MKLKPGLEQGRDRLLEITQRRKKLTARTSIEEQDDDTSDRVRHEPVRYRRH